MGNMRARVGLKTQTVLLAPRHTILGTDDESSSFKPSDDVSDDDGNEYWRGYGKPITGSEKARQAARSICWLERQPLMRSC